MPSAPTDPGAYIAQLLNETFDLVFDHPLGLRARFEVA
jgi:hypothetical protein